MKSFVHLTLAALGFAFSCSGGAPAGAANGDEALLQVRDPRFRVETVASGLEVPWAFAFLPNGNIVFTERPGRVRIIEKSQLRPEPVYAVPDVEPSSESGLMDLSLHP